MLNQETIKPLTNTRKIYKGWEKKIYKYEKR